MLKHVGNGMLKHTYRYDIKRPLLPLYSSLHRLSVFKFFKYHFNTKYQYHLFLFKKTTNTGMVPVNLPLTAGGGGMVGEGRYGMSENGNCNYL